MASDPTYIPNPSAMRTTEPLPSPTFDTLVNVLFQATSPDAGTLSRATAYLSDLEAHPSFWLLLLEVAFERNVRIEVQRVAQERAGMSAAGYADEENTLRRWSAIRTVAIIRFKNGVDKYWRSRVVNRVTITIPQETKEKLRQGLFRCLDEPDRTIALQASVAIARIARHDFPNSWPALFTSLQEAMVQAHARLNRLEAQPVGSSLDHNRLILLRASDVCQKTLKELATVRILAGKIRMTELSRQLLPILVPMLQQLFNETFANSSVDWRQWSASPYLAQRIRTSHLLLKSVTYLAVADMGTITRNSTAAGGLAANMSQDFFRTTPAMLQTIRDARLAYIHSVQGAGKSLDETSKATLLALQKHYLAFGKMYLALLLRDKSKAVAWPGWDEVVWWYWQQAKEATPQELSVTSKSVNSGPESALLQRHPPKLIVHSLVLLRQSLQDWKTTLSTPALFADQSVITDVVDVLVGKLMLLTQDDLELWESDAEEWSVAEEADVYDVDVRPAAERTLMVLASTSKSEPSVGELLWAKFEQVGQRPLEGTLQDSVERDAIYAALGRCRDQLPYSRDILSQVTSQRLVREAALDAGSGPTLVILRRRIAWLIWEWSEHIVPTDRPAVYHLLVSLLEDVAGKTDAAVRMAVARSLAALADALEFDSDGFQPFVDVALTRLATLAAASDLHEMDSIKTCTNAMSILIERLGPRVAPHLQSLANLVPSLWMKEDAEFKAKPSVIVFVGKLVRSVELIPEGNKGSGDLLHGIVEVIVRDSLQPATSALLGKDALELWIRALRSSSTMTQPLFRLLDLLGPLLGQPDFCPEACRVAQESTLMAPQQVLAQHGSTLMAEFAKIVGDPLSALILHPITAVDVMMQTVHAQSVQPGDWARLLDESGLFYALLGSTLKVNESAIVSGYYVALLARICYMTNGTRLFLDLVQSTALKLEGPACQVTRQVTKPMIVLWCKRFESMASSRKRKITCLGLASLLAASDPNVEAEVFECTPDMIGVWMDMLSDLREDANGEPPPPPNAPPSSPLLLNRTFSQSELTRRSPSPALSIPGLEGLDDDGDWLEDTSPGKARMAELNRMDPVNTVKLAAHVSASLNAAQQKGSQTFHAALSTMDAVVLDILQKDLTR